MTQLLKIIAMGYLEWLSDHTLWEKTSGTTCWYVLFKNKSSVMSLIFNIVDF